MRRCPGLIGGDDDLVVEPRGGCEAIVKQSLEIAADRLLAVTTLSLDISGIELLFPLNVGANAIISPSE